MSSFEALIISKSDEGQKVGWTTLDEGDLMEGDVTIRVTHSTINYKDGLAITGKAPIVRRWPMIPGVDLAGIVTASAHSDFKPGDEVVANGSGIGEGHYGGYAEMARLKSDWVVPLPDGLTRADCMAIGTAGVTSMLCVQALEAHDVKMDSGPVLVTGAAGGVGSVAVAILAHLGYRVAASTGRPETGDYLRSLGAAEIVLREEFTGSPRPLGKARWAGAIDVAGSTTLANVISQIEYGGTVAACGLAQGMDLPTNVAPFILRNVTLAGIDSVMTPKAKRIETWKRLAKDLDLGKLRAMTETRSIRDAVALAPEIVAGRVKGRIVFELGGGV
ncbi:MAG: oxidoreductase [Hyphomicrobiales bacterium]|nr:oxidoreductase [Hyphomicrobiales bacterium]